MNEGIRVIDILSMKEREELRECEINILNAETLYEVALNQARAELIMKMAKKRYFVKKNEESKQKEVM